MRGDRGAGIATVLLVMAVLGTIALTLASFTTFHMRVATRQSQGDQARNLADSVLTAAKDRLVDQPGFGSGSTTATDVITVQFSPDQPAGRLTFHAPLAAEWDVPVSVNNLEGDASVVLPDGRTLPPFSAYLVARAEYGGVPKVLECVLRVPLYKYALATSGTIVSNGGLLVAAIDEDTDLSAGLDAVPVDELKEGHLAAQSTSQTVLESTSSGSLITGDVVSGGSVTLGAQTSVKGSVKQNHEKEELPDLDPTDYDPAGWAGLETISDPNLYPPSPLEPVKLEGVWRSGEDLQINGDLELDGGYLYVDGRLNITGGVKGKGTIFVTGDISVAQASGFSTDNVQAMVAGGGISISGGGSPSERNNSFFNGILFSHGDMSLSNVTVVGSVVNNSTEESVMELNNVAFLHNPDTITFDFGFPGNTDSAEFGDEYWFQFRPSAENFAAFFSPEDDAFDLTLANIPFRVFQIADMSAYYADSAIFVGEYDSAQEFIDANSGSLDAQDESDTHEEAIRFIEAFQAAIQQANELYQQTRQESLKRGEFTLEPNQFVPFQDRVRVIWSRELPAE